LAVRWYLRHGLSFRDVEELLAERGIDVDHVPAGVAVARMARVLRTALMTACRSVGARY
jgi:IS6 family transposase